ncbi:MAG: hypothetical protein KKA67_03820 [Spirochaetes bacterium]|nr:hypothetical protein [Spirochaetota bacterium]MBU1079566.1 hypothetical protein [Spirochaetota bacterium]
MEIGPIIAVLCVFIGAPSVVFGFILLNKGGARRLELEKYRVRELELSVERERLRIEALKEENKKLDRMIEHRIDAL